MTMLAIACAHPETKKDVIIAHFNHNMRPSANDDFEFVKNKAIELGLPFIYDVAEPGELKSEEEARQARYDFLRAVSVHIGIHDSEIITAHHLNDVIESVVINIIRGTGWRGLAPFSDPYIARFFVRFNMTKMDVLVNSVAHDVVYRQDPTNNENTYLRNRVREMMFGKMDEMEIRTFIADYYFKQLDLKNKIEETVKELLPKNGIYQRSWFKNLDDDIALEILRIGLFEACLPAATRPQLKDFLKAIRTYAPEKDFNLPKGHLVTMHKTYFELRRNM